MEKPAALIREIEVNQAKLALLQKEHARIGQEISDLSARNRAKIVELVETTLETLDFGEVPIHMLVSKLTKLSEELTHESPGGDDRIAVFVRFGRNASSANRQVLVSAGLHWHGRDGGWVGQVTEMQLARLREAFGDRVSGSKSEEAGGSAKKPLHSAPDVPSKSVPPSFAFPCPARI